MANTFWSAYHTVRMSGTAWAAVVIPVVVMLLVTVIAFCDWVLQSF